MDSRILKLRKALQEIISECPNPKLSYGMKIVKIAQSALLEDNSDNVNPYVFINKEI